MSSAEAGIQEETSRPTTSAPAQKMQRTSMDALEVLFHPRSRSMPMLQDSNSGFVLDQHQIKHYHSTLLSPTLVASPASSSQRDGMDNTFRNSNSTNTKRMSSNFPLGASKAVKSKKSRPMSLSSMLLQNDQQINSPQPRLPHQSKATRWANRGGIGANEMMVDLETAGVFVPSNGRRLRAEFVYRSVIQCADEIRQRGLVHANIFTNPSPKKVITAMIALMIDQDRCDLYTMKCLRIDTVASLFLNLMSQMSNPIIPYTIMEHYFQQSGHATRSSPSPSPPTSRRNSENPRQSVERPNYATVGDSLPVIPALPLKDASRASSHAGYAWAREYFDLHSFLAALPAMNRVILLEVLHLCQELLDHQIQNRLTIHRLVQQVAPALFSTVFDQKILETMAGGSRRCSVYGDSISSQDGSRAESHLFMIILVRFLAVSSASYNSPAVDPGMGAFRAAVSDEGSSCSMQNVEPFGRHPSQAPSSSAASGIEENVYQNQSSAFRKSQHWHHNEQQEYHSRLERSFQEMEILQRPSQHFGYHPAKHRQAAQQLQQQQQNKRSSSISVDDLGISKKIHDPLRSPSQDSNTGLNVSDGFALPGPSLESGHRDHIWHGHRRVEQQSTIM
ncbi:hypothetical protein BGZ95_000064 [Linnemannia exigua]|uniref:Rho-GAP domain-containing protein n=1 Tax=Linnemannia exigua TaxID=604196 RepID=A0AAD4HA14_9FUNG|nr:hypothetical protein BGZ95_000064 [Linnemannia exigua]